MLLVTLLLLFMSIVSATELPHDSNTDSINEMVKDTHSLSENLDSVVEDKVMQKEEKKIKTSSYNTNVSNFNELVNRVKEAQNNNYEYYTINLNKGDYNATEVISYTGNFLNTLVINGNNNTLYGNNQKEFMNIKGSVYLVNLTLVNFNASTRGCIYGEHYSCITVENCTFINNSNNMIYSEGIVQIFDSTFEKNTAGRLFNTGGAIYSAGDTNLIQNCTFKDNVAANGAAIFIAENYGDTLLYNNTFNNNTATNGGAVFFTSNKKHGQIDNNYFINNKATNGGAIYIHGTTGYATFNNNIFINNRAEIVGGAIESKENININLIKSNFINNHASYGGAIYGDIIIDNCKFSNNSANYGGATYYGKISNCKFANNTADKNGGALHSPTTVSDSMFFNNSAHYPINQTLDIMFNLNNSGYGSAIYNDKDNSNITGNTFIQNNAYRTGKAITSQKTAIIKDNINEDTSIYSNTIFNKADNVSITNNIFEDTLKDKSIYTSISLQTVIGTIGEKLTLTAKVTDEYDLNVQYGSVIFKINGVTIKDNGKLTGSSTPLKAKVDNGVATATITPSLEMKNANRLTASYIPSGSYNSSVSSAVKMRIFRRNASIVISSNVKTIKQGQILILKAQVYDTTNGRKTNNLIDYADEFVYFKVNGITLKDSEGNMLKVKLVNGVATVNYTIPLGISCVTDGKSMTVKNHTILAGFYNKNYQEDIRNTSTFQVERSTITININNATVNNKTHKLSLMATIKDYLGNVVIGPNKCVIKINGISIRNGTQQMYCYSNNGVLNVKDISIPEYNKYVSIEIVTQDRLAYKSQRNTTYTIDIIN